jgi:hypothetical protein
MGIVVDGESDDDRLRPSNQPIVSRKKAQEAQKESNFLRLLRLFAAKIYA